MKIKLPVESEDAVVNATVVMPAVGFCATLSPAASVSDAPVTCPPIAGDAVGTLITHLDPSNGYFFLATTPAAAPTLMVLVVSTDDAGLRAAVTAFVGVI